MEPKRPWVDQHWFWRGFQSAIFLYAQCGPCLAWRESHRQKKQYKQEKKERARNTDHPDVIRQPAPHEVNPSWAEEIRLGPSPPKRGRRRANTKNSRDTASSATLVASDTAGSSKSDLPTDGKDKLPLSWNPKRYQRADEEYAYVDERPEMVYAQQGLIRRGSSVGISPWVAQSGKMPEKPKRTYTPSVTMPPVNELHPPVVSTLPAKKEDRAWMTAPPPSAAFMHGKKGVTTRSRSGSGTRSLRNTDTSLSRQVVQKIVEDKMKSGEAKADDNKTAALASTDADTRLHSHAKSTAPPAVRRSGSTSPFRLAREKEPVTPTKPKRRPAPLRLNTDKSSKSASTTVSSDAASEMSSSSSDSRQRGRPKTTTSTSNQSRTTARSALNSHPISPPASTANASKDSTVAQPMLASAPSADASHLSTLEPKRDSATPTPLSSSYHAVDTVQTSPRKGKDASRAADASRLLVKDSSLHVLQDVVDSSLLLDNRWVRSPVVEARIPLPPGDSPHKDDDILTRFAHVSAKEELLMQEGARRWSWGV